ncbi:MAG: hypothetical protein Q9195_005279 [Heterodermia aff. obscurata]
MSKPSTTFPPKPASSFEAQRAALLLDISAVSIPLPPTHPFSPFLPPHSPTQSMESVLQNINKLNRSLEGVIAVGNEFGAVEALWSQFEHVMAREDGKEDEVDEGEGTQ